MQLLRHGYVSLRRAPALALVIIATLALALAASVLVFSLLHTFLLRPLPLGNAARYAVIFEHSVKSGHANALSLTYDNLAAVQTRSTAFTRFGVFRSDSALVHGADAAEAIALQRVSAEAFPMMGAPAALGTVITPANVQVGGLRAIVLSDALWRRLFNAEPGVVGRTIRIGDQLHHVVGVMPPDFTPPTRDQQAEAWPALLPEDYTARADTPLRHHIRHYVWGELAPGRSLAAANAELAALGTALREEFPIQNNDRGFFAIALRDELLGGFGRQLVLLQAAVLLVLTVACFNCLCLLVARSLQRRREFAVRLALGATRRRLFAQIFAESLWLALPAAALALALASFALPYAAALVPTDAQAMLRVLPEPTVDLSVTVTVVVAALAISLLFSATPLLQTRRLNLESALREGGRSTGTRGTQRAARALAIGQVAVAAALLISAALLVRSQQALQRIAPGLPLAELDLFHVGLRGHEYTTDANRRLQLFEAFRDKLRALPGVRDVAVASYMFVEAPNGYQGLVQEGDGLLLADTPKRALPCYVLPGAFSALGIPLLEGRALEETDTLGRPPVAVVSASLAAKYWPGESPVGRRVRVNPLGNQWVEIVGVVADVLGSGNQPRPVETVYLTIAQGSPPGLGMGFFLRYQGAPPSERLLRRALSELDPALQILAHTAPAQIYTRSAWQSRFVTRLVVGFALLAVLLALAGIYAVNAFFVERRLTEFGIRSALGATRQNLLTLVLRNAARFTTAGVVLGIFLAFAASRSLAGLLYGVGSVDALAYLGAGALMYLSSLLAAFFPARRAAKVDPIVALRAE
jgi:putative ABC transport system permease protein